MSTLINRAAVIVTFPGEHMPIVLGPFMHWNSACDMRDDVTEYLLNEHEMESGVDYSISVACCHSTSTKTPLFGDIIRTIAQKDMERE